jgi:hypothetical protein
MNNEEIEYKRYMVSSRIKYLNGLRNLILAGESEYSLEDVNSKIKALTNMLEML